MRSFLIRWSEKTSLLFMLFACGLPCSPVVCVVRNLETVDLLVALF